eukprot:5709588-Amphidinium_carterae.1
MGTPSPLSMGNNAQSAVYVVEVTMRRMPSSQGLFPCERDLLDSRTLLQPQQLLSIRHFSSMSWYDAGPSRPPTWLVALVMLIAAVADCSYTCGEVWASATRRNHVCCVTWDTVGGGGRLRRLKA